MSDEYYKILMVRTKLSPWSPASSWYIDIEELMLRNNITKMKVTYGSGRSRWFKLIEHRTPR